MQSDGESCSGNWSVCCECSDAPCLLGCPVLVAEVTQPSLGVGYEIGRAVEHQKRVLCLFRKDSGQSEHCSANCCY